MRNSIRFYFLWNLGNEEILPQKTMHEKQKISEDLINSYLGTVTYKAYLKGAEIKNLSKFSAEYLHTCNSVL
jgi:hypothetical protein